MLLPPQTAKISDPFSLYWQSCFARASRVPSTLYQSFKNRTAYFRLHPSVRRLGSLRLCTHHPYHSATGLYFFVGIAGCQVSYHGGMFWYTRWGLAFEFFIGWPHDVIEDGYASLSTLSGTWQLCASKGPEPLYVFKDPLEGYA